MIIAPLNPYNQTGAVAYLRKLPYRNALTLSNVTQLRSRCDVLVAEENTVVGVASTYLDLPLPNLTFVVNSDAALEALLHTLADRNPQLRAGKVFALLPEVRRNQLARVAHILDTQIEYQMAVEPESLRMSTGPEARRLATDDIPQIEALARDSGLTVWHNNTLSLGPAFGYFVGDQLVAMAATHFATPEVVEIGHIATHPDYRRQGYASACTATLAQAAFALAPRVFLMVLESNTPAIALYKRLGFYANESFYMTRFTL